MAIEAIASVVPASYPHSNRVYALVSRGERPDLADPDALKKVKAVTLLIVGAENSKEIISFNKR